MKIAICMLAAAPLFAGDLERFTDVKLNQTQRNEACLALRGMKTPEVITAMRASLEDMRVQSCAGVNLRVAGAEKELIDALHDGNPMVRAVAAREIGTMEKLALLPELRKAVEDKDLLVQTNAMEGLVRYRDHSSAPALREIALLGGMLTSMAMDQLTQWNDEAVPAIARKLVMRPEPGDLLAGIRALGIAGDKQDLPRLKELAKNDEMASAGGRGFGLMPAVSISKAAETAIARIEQRANR
jgi:HEAT repeat protein